MESKHMDINSESYWLYHTPSKVAKGYPFYVTECGFFSGNQGYFTERDYKNSYLLIYTLSGSGSFLYNHHHDEIHKGQAILLNCNNAHSYHTLKAPWQFYWIHFNGSGTAHYESLINDTTINLIDIFDSNDFIQYFHKIHEMLNQHDVHTDLKASLYLTQFMTQMLYNKKRPKDEKSFRFQQDIRRSVSYIQDHYQDDLSVEFLANIAFLSKFHFLRLFKHYMGISPYDYVIHYRITMTKPLLQNTAASIQVIAEQVGYKNVNNYIRNFKKLVGMTPHQYRLSWRV